MVRLHLPATLAFLGLVFGASACPEPDPMGDDDTADADDELRVALDGGPVEVRLFEDDQPNDYNEK